MRKIGFIVAIVSICSICFGLCACGEKIDIQSEADAVEYLKEYVDEHDEWDAIAYEIGVSSSSSGYFSSNSHADKQNENWVVVLQGSMGGRYFAYIAVVSPSGEILEKQIRQA